MINSRITRQSTHLSLRGKNFRRGQGFAMPAEARNLAVVDPSERGSVGPDSAARRGSVTVAAASGDRQALLMALRDKIAEQIDRGAPARDLAALSRRLLEISREIGWHR